MDIIPELLHQPRVHVPAGRGGIVEVLLERLQVNLLPIYCPQASTRLLSLQSTSSTTSTLASSPPNLPPPPVSSYQPTSTCHLGSVATAS